MDGDILVSTDQMMRGFARWETEFRKDPRAFRSTVEALIAGDTPEMLGKACADYFRSLLIQVR